MAERVRASINPDVLAWARQTAGFTLEQAAQKISVRPEKLQAWESGEDKPTMNQLRTAAKVYKRPSALFYRSAAPSNPPTIPDFRQLPDVDSISTPVLLYEIRRAFERRSIALELTNQLGESPKDFSLKSDMSEPPDILALRIRNALGVSLKTQFSWRDHYAALRFWTSAIENIGIFIFHVRNIELSQMRGFSISEHPFPVIGINGKDSPRGRIFTIIHELVHIILNNGGICDLRDEFESGAHDSIEIYCNQVAGKVLVPDEILLSQSTVRENENGMHWDERQLRDLANRFKVSQEVILRRLLSLGRTTKAFYSEKRKEYEEIYQRERADRDGFVPYFRLVLRDNGNAYTSLVIDAYNNEAISSRDLSNFLGGVKLDYIQRIEQALISGEGSVE